MAKAVPSYARQTGLSCIACHQGYLALNSYGRQFKVSGYTASSGETLLPPLAVYLQPSLTITEWFAAERRLYPGGEVAAFQQGGRPVVLAEEQREVLGQYTIYNHFNGSRRNFDGTGRNTFDNNTLYLEA